VEHGYRIEMTPTRRSFVRGLAGIAVAAGGVAGTASAGHDGAWTAVTTPTSDELHGLARTSDGVYAVGANGVVLRRAGDRYETVLADGPTGNGTNLHAAAVTEDGHGLWLVGASGVVASCDVRTGEWTDRSAPTGSTNTLTDVAVTGSAGAATVHVGGDAGAVYRSTGNGDPGTWTAATPGSGAGITAVDAVGPDTVHAVDGDAAVFAGGDGRYERIGLADADHDYYAVHARPEGPVVAGGGGSVASYDGAWHRDDTGTDADLRDVGVCDCGCVLAVGDGVAHEHDGEWRRAIPAGESLNAVLPCDGERAVAAGAAGTVIER